MSFKLSLEQVAQALGGTLHGVAGDASVQSVCASSNQVGPGTLFVALPGTRHDGHRFVDDARARGAVAAVVSSADALKKGPGIVVADTHEAFAKLSALFEGEPSRSMRVVGITGTNGKTTTNWLVHHLLHALFGSSVRIGTLGVEAIADGKGCFTQADTLTTPGAQDLQRVLAQARAAQVQCAVMEVSSHALEQRRADGVQFDIAVFTNLTRDHLDYHETMERYLAAKLRLFDLLAQSEKPARVAVVNLDDPAGAQAMGYAVARSLPVITVGRSAQATLRIVGVTIRDGWSALQLAWQGRQYELRSPFIGDHNAENLSAALAVALSLDVNLDAAIEALASAPQVPGRLQLIEAAGVRAYIDYAHTPDALARALHAVRQGTTGKVWVVFGCGGDRDRGKRPEMCQVACNGADFVVVTSDNPRTESPQQIIDDILGRPPATVRHVDPDRRAAIHYALAQASVGDVVLVAGKGHEQYQIIGETKHPFSDEEQVRAALADRAAEER